MSFSTHKTKSALNAKKKPPPRPPPPNFTKYKKRTRQFGGSVSSSFSSSTSSLASSKKSFEYEVPVSNIVWPVHSQQNSVPHGNGGSFHSYISTNSTKPGNSSNLNVPSFFGPTIIRPHVKKQQKPEDFGPSGSPPMPNIPPPSPPKEYNEIETPYGIALYDYRASHPSDLDFQAGDVVIFLRRINDDWIQGKIIDKEGMFPEKFVEVKVPLKGEENIVTALYDFPGQISGDLSFKEGQKINVTRKISEEWLYGESNGLVGQFPSNFVNRVPNKL
ncbi:hypothetical protein GWI33_018405 [Rhynchophorus ferrugineus]|uniref:SH3 domain-containing protein n=1 Tax=Rhynchophorus ferrugineus TaxID=354439 RepID=A0A834HTL1_RHYFE|nr:hypothetical protein GWI33_018405 [Rhynchophorus ferrugineus]